jgi:hypothetical protein
VGFFLEEPLNLGLSRSAKAIPENIPADKKVAKTAANIILLCMLIPLSWFNVLLTPNNSDS